MLKLKKYKPYLLLISISLLSIWALTFFQFIPKWDNLDCYLPYKYFLSDNLWHGHGPWWNPYIRLGYPAYSDMQSGIWNPIVWVLFLFGKYTTKSLILEIIIYDIICVLGIYKFTELYVKNRFVRYIVSLSYSLSGFMVDNSQIMIFIMGYAWLPWILYYLFKFNRSRFYKDIIFASFFIALNVSSASPAYSIILIYIVLGVFFSNFVADIIKRHFDRRLISGYILLVVMSILLLLPFIISFFDYLPYFNRSSRLTYGSMLLSGSFDFAEYISFFLPYSVNSGTDIFSPTPPTLRNGYFGIFSVIILIFSLLKVRKRSMWFFVFLGIFSLFIAAGDYLPIFHFLYEYFPGFGLFKHLSFLRGYAIFCFLMAVGIGLEDIIYRGLFSIKQYLFLVVFFAIFYILLTVYSAFRISWVGVKENILDLIGLEEFSRGGIYVHIFINGVIISVLLVLYLYLFQRRRYKPELLLLIFVVVDMFLMFQLSVPTTLINNLSFQDHISGFKSLPDTINQQPTCVPLKEVSEGDFYISALWENKSIFSKTVHYGGHNASKSRYFFEMSTRGDLDFIVENPIFYVPYVDLDSLRDTVFVPNVAISLPFGVSVDSRTKILGSVIGYNRFDVDIDNRGNGASFVVLSQNYHHFWKAFIDGVFVRVYRVNTGLMGVDIPANFCGTVRFEFSPRLVLIVSFFVSLVGYFVIFFMFLFIKNYELRITN